MEGQEQRLWDLSDTDLERALGLDAMPAVVTGIQTGHGQEAQALILPLPAIPGQLNECLQCVLTPIYFWSSSKVEPG